MRYITIGSGSAVPQRERSAPCHFISTGDHNIVVDLGPGSTWGLIRHGNIGLPDIDLILFTHLHMDHCADLAPLLFALRSPDLTRFKPLYISGPQGLLEHYRKLQLIWEHRVDPAGFDLIMSEWGEAEFPRHTYIVDAAPTVHSLTNLAWRIDTGIEGERGIVITGDGQPTNELVRLAVSADHVLVAESAAGPGELLEGHMNPVQAGELASRCYSKKLILTHINPGAETENILEEAMTRFHGPVVVAEDGMIIDID
jgi:ribonuclease BN (tRNA processing enzyme)